MERSKSSCLAVDFTDSTIVVQMARLWNQSSVLFMAHRSIHYSLFCLGRPMEF